VPTFYGNKTKNYIAKQFFVEYSMFLNFNGEVREEGVALLRADNRGFRYGDGLFETMLVRQGKVRLGEYHIERLVAGMRLLRLEFPRPFGLDMLEGQIRELCARNGHGAFARARLTVYRSGGGLYNAPDRQADFVIQTSDLEGGGGWRSGGPGGGSWLSGGGPGGGPWLSGEGPGGGPGREEEGLVLDVFPDGRRACDIYSGIKSNNYQLSTQAGLFAGERGLDDCVLLNGYGRVAETTVANIWWVRGGGLYTPPLSEGCVAGVMRRWLLEALPAAGYSVEEAPIGPDGLAEAEEIFITNAIRGIRWVRSFRGLGFGCRLAAAIRDEIIHKI
jgi:branched-chain amino acid aminotransferase